MSDEAKRLVAELRYHCECRCLMCSPKAADLIERQATALAEIESRHQLTSLNGVTMTCKECKGTTFPCDTIAAIKRLRKEKP